MDLATLIFASNNSLTTKKKKKKGHAAQDWTPIEI